MVQAGRRRARSPMLAEAIGSLFDDTEEVQEEGMNDDGEDASPELLWVIILKFGKRKAGWLLRKPARSRG